MDRSGLIEVLKYQQWEKCKGELRALEALEGSSTNHSDSKSKWWRLKEVIEAFIEQIEDEELEC